MIPVIKVGTYSTNESIKEAKLLKILKRNVSIYEWFKYKNLFGIINQHPYKRLKIKIHECFLFNRIILHTWKSCSYFIGNYNFLKKNKKRKEKSVIS